MVTDQSVYQPVLATVFTHIERLLNSANKDNQALHDYLESWQTMAELTEEINNFALQDIILLFLEFCEQIFNSVEKLTDKQKQLLSKWAILFENYIKTPDDPQTINSLISCLNDPLLKTQLSADDKAMLLQSFHLTGVKRQAVDEEILLDEIEPLAGLLINSKETLLELEGIEPSLANAVLGIKESSNEEIVIVEPVSVNPKFISSISNEFVLLIKNLSPAIVDLSDGKAFKTGLKTHYLKFGYLAKACNTLGLQGLKQVFEYLSTNIEDGCENETGFSENERTLFKECLLLIQAYLMDVTDKSNALALVHHLQANDWKSPLDKKQAQALTPLLLALVLSSQDEQLESRKTIAEKTDISLTLPKAVNQELLNSLFNELPVLTANFSAVLQKIISSPANVKQLLEAQRIAHTLKGSGNIVGITGIAVLTHHLEEILAYLTEKQRVPTKALAISLVEAADCLEVMSETILSGQHQSPDDALQVLQSILNWSNKIAKNGLPENHEKTETGGALPSEPKMDYHAIPTANTQESPTMIRVSRQLIDKLLRMTGEGSILRGQFKEQINHFSEELKTLNQLTWAMQSRVSELEQAVNFQRHSLDNKEVNPEFDSLEMEQYNELHTATNRLTEVATDIRNLNISMDDQLINLKYLMMDEEVIQKENQAMIQSIRMIPASSITLRCQRIVRQACRITNKEIELKIKGDEVLIDSEILNGMIDPLMHLLRNSVDHGIESTATREKNNKHPVGKINLEFTRKGNYVVIHCQDDGHGLSNEKILHTAVKKGLVAIEQKLTDAEIHQLILLPGFSTRTKVTQISGRGIGMDVVQTKISELQGQMSLDSVEGEGLSIEISIPQTLSSMLSLLVRCGGKTMAVSNRGLQKIYHPDDYELIENSTTELICQIAETHYSTRYFGELLGMSTLVYNHPRQKLPALRIIDDIGKTYFIFVDELLGYKDLLVKNMGHYISHIQGITGASILGNGEVAPVIDLVEMLHHAAKYDFLSADITKEMREQEGDLSVALVVDDSLSARRAVVILLEDYGLEVRTAIDGLDAIKQMEDKQPDIVVVDLEMPRMNGIELTAHIKGCQETKHIPVIMITSRMTEKHHKQAQAAGITTFMTKPFSTEELINHVSRLLADS